MSCGSVIGVCVFFMPTPAWAYLDPGTGSILLQGLLAAFAVVAGVVSVYWQRLRMAFNSLFARREPAATDPNRDPED